MGESETWRNERTEVVQCAMKKNNEWGCQSPGTKQDKKGTKELEGETVNRNRNIEQAPNCSEETDEVKAKERVREEQEQQNGTEQIE